MCYVWLWVAFWWWFLGWRHRLQCIVVLQAFLRLLKLLKLAVWKLDLSREGLTLSHGVLDHGLNLCRNIPLRTVKTTNITSQTYCLKHNLFPLTQVWHLDILRPGDQCFPLYLSSDHFLLYCVLCPVQTVLLMNNTAGLELCGGLRRM